MVLSGFVCENVAFFNNTNPHDGMQMISIYLITGVIALASLVYFIIEAVKNKTKPVWIIIFIMIMMAGMCILTIWIQPDNATYLYKGETLNVVLSLEKKITSTIQLVLTLLSAYILIGPYRRRLLDQKRRNWIYRLFAIYVGITIVASFFIDKELYIDFFTTEKNTLVEPASSIYLLPETYGLSLLIGICALGINNIYHRSWVNHLFMFVFTFFALFSKCEIATTLSVLFVIFYSIGDIIYGLANKKAVKTAITSILFIAVIAGLIYLGTLFIKFKVPFFVNLGDFLTEYFGKTLSFHLTQEHEAERATAWAIINLNSSNFWFGVGHGLSNTLMHLFYFGNDIAYKYSVVNASSAFHEIFLRSGVIGVVAYYGAMIYFLVCIVILFVKKRRLFAYTYLLCFLAMMVHSLTNSTIFFEASAKGIGFTILFYIPVIAEVHNVLDKNHIKDRNAIKNLKIVNAEKSPHIMMNILSIVMIGFIGTLLSLLGSSFVYETNTRLMVIIVPLIIFAILWIYGSFVIMKYFEVHHYLRDTFFKPLGMMIPALIYFVIAFFANKYLSIYLLEDSNFSIMLMGGLNLSIAFIIYVIFPSYKKKQIYRYIMARELIAMNDDLKAEDKR